MLLCNAPLIILRSTNILRPQASHTIHDLLSKCCVNNWQWRQCHSTSPVTLSHGCYASICCFVL